MNKLFGVFVLFYLCLVVFLVIDVGANNEKSLHRPRRYLNFLNVTRWYIKINFKSNMVPWNQLFAQAVGFRVNWDTVPNSFHAYQHFISRRAVYDQIELLINRNGLDGFHCVRRAICEMETISEPRELYHRILKIVFRNKSTATERWHNVTSGDCLQAIWHCPFSILDVSQYTDIE